MLMYGRVHEIIGRVHSSPHKAEVVFGGKLIYPCLELRGSLLEYIFGCTS